MQVFSACTRILEVRKIMWSRVPLKLHLLLFSYKETAPQSPVDIYPLLRADQIILSVEGQGRLQTGGTIISARRKLMSRNHHHGALSCEKKDGAAVRERGTTIVSIFPLGFCRVLTLVTRIPRPPCSTTSSTKNIPPVTLFV